MGTHVPYGITQYYLPPGRGDIPTFTPAEAGTWVSDPGEMQGWVDLVGWLQPEMVYPPEDGHPSTHWRTPLTTTPRRQTNTHSKLFQTYHFEHLQKPLPKIWKFFNGVRTRQLKNGWNLYMISNQKTAFAQLKNTFLTTF